MKGEFEHDEEQTCLTVSDVLKEEHVNNVLLKLLVPIYSLWNASIAFYKKIKENYAKHWAQAKFS